MKPEKTKTRKSLEFVNHLCDIVLHDSDRIAIIVKDITETLAQIDTNHLPEGDRQKIIFCLTKLWELENDLYDKDEFY